MQKVALIAKGNSNKSIKFFKAVNLNEFLPEIQIEISFTQFASEAISLAKQFAESNYDFVIACGGDGTSFEVLNGILKSKNPSVVFGVFPIGSANDFAKAQKLSKSFKYLIKRIITCKTKAIDVGKINLSNRKKKYYFLNVFDVGFGPEVVKKVNAQKHILSPGLSFLWAITKTLFTYKTIEINIAFDSKSYDGKTLLGAVSNSSCFGGGIYISPDAKINDAKLNLTRIGNVSMLDYLLQIGKLKKGKLVNHPEISYHQISKVSFSSNHHVGVEADGEYLGELPCTVEIKPKLLKLLDTST